MQRITSCSKMLCDAALPHKLKIHSAYFTLCAVHLNLNISKLKTGVMKRARDRIGFRCPSFFDPDPDLNKSSQLNKLNQLKEYSNYLDNRSAIFKGFF